jgi:hypothetical protein
LVSQKILSMSTTVPSPGGQTSGSTQPPEPPSAGRVEGVGRPLGLPQGLPHASPGAEPYNTVAVLSRAAPELARGRADARPTGRPTIPACKIKTSGRRWAVKRREILGNPEK